MKTLLLGAALAALTIQPALAREITTRAEFWKVVNNAEKYATQQYDAGYYHVWKGDGFRARRFDLSEPSNMVGFYDLCFEDNSFNPKTCYNSTGAKWIMTFGANKNYPNEWNPGPMLRTSFPGDTPPDLFADH